MTTTEQTRQAKADQGKRRRGSGVTEATSEHRQLASGGDVLASVLPRSVIASGHITVTARQWARAVGYSFELHRYLTDDVPS